MFENRPLVVVSSTRESVVAAVAEAAAVAAVVAAVSAVVFLPPGLLPLLARPPEARARRQMMTAGLMVASGWTTWDRLLYRGLCYAGLRLALAKGFGLRPRLLLPFGQKRELFTLFVLILGHFLCSVVTTVTFSSNFINLDNNLKNLENQKKIKN